MSEPLGVFAPLGMDPSPFGMDLLPVGGIREMGCRLLATAFRCCFALPSFCFSHFLLG